ncbi:unnamed protein product [Urochloa humidicola]
MTHSKISLKLLVKTKSKSKQVLFTEAGKEFVHFVSLLMLRLVSAGTMHGSVEHNYTTCTWVSTTRAHPNCSWCRQVGAAPPRVLHPDVCNMLLLCIIYFHPKDQHIYIFFI